MTEQETTTQEGDIKPRNIFDAVDSLEQALSLQEVKNEVEPSTLETRIQGIAERIFNKPNCFLEQNPHPGEQVKILESMVFLDQTSQEKSTKIILPSDILELYIFKNINWEKAKRNLYDKDGLGNYYYDRPLAVEMKKFDFKRFEEEIKDSEKYEFMWEKSVKEINHSIKNKGYDWEGNLTFGVSSFLAESSWLKELDSQRFEQDVKIGSEELDIVARYIGREMKESSHPLTFCYLYERALTINAKEIKKRITIHKEYGSQIRERAKKDMQEQELGERGIDKAWEWMNVQSIIKPEDENFPEITVHRELFKKMLTQLEDMVLFRRETHENVFKYARMLRDQEIKVEN